MRLLPGTVPPFARRARQLTCLIAMMFAMTVASSAAVERFEMEFNKAAYHVGEDGSQIATGETPTVILADGSHTITLTLPSGNDPWFLRVEPMVNP